MTTFNKCEACLDACTTFNECEACLDITCTTNTLLPSECCISCHRVWLKKTKNQTTATGESLIELRQELEQALVTSVPSDPEFLIELRNIRYFLTEVKKIIDDDVQYDSRLDSRCPCCLNIVSRDLSQGTDPHSLACSDSNCVAKNESSSGSFCSNCKCHSHTHEGFNVSCEEHNHIEQVYHSAISKQILSALPIYDKKFYSHKRDEAAFLALIKNKDFRRCPCYDWDDLRYLEIEGFYPNIGHPVPFFAFPGACKRLTDHFPKEVWSQVREWEFARNYERKLLSEGKITENEALTSIYPKHRWNEVICNAESGVEKTDCDVMRCGNHNAERITHEIADYADKYQRRKGDAIKRNGCGRSIGWSNWVRVTPNVTTSHTASPGYHKNRQIVETLSTEDVGMHYKCDCCGKPSRKLSCMCIDPMCSHKYKRTCANCFLSTGEGITQQQWQFIYKEQNGKCAVFETQPGSDVFTGSIQSNHNRSYDVRVVRDANGDLELIRTSRRWNNWGHTHEVDVKVGVIQFDGETPPHFSKLSGYKATIILNDEKMISHGTDGIQSIEICPVGAPSSLSQFACCVANKHVLNWFELPEFEKRLSRRLELSNQKSSMITNAIRTFKTNRAIGWYMFIKEHPAFKACLKGDRKKLSICTVSTCQQLYPRFRKQHRMCLSCHKTQSSKKCKNCKCKFKPNNPGHKFCNKCGKQTIKKKAKLSRPLAHATAVRAC